MITKDNIKIHLELARYCLLQLYLAFSLEGISRGVRLCPTRRDPKNFYLLTGCGLPSSTTKKIFLAFEGHKGRKAKKGQNFPKNKYGSKCLKLPNSARNPIKIFSPL